jgi:hypothetical protein
MADIEISVTVEAHIATGKGLEIARRSNPLSLWVGPSAQANPARSICMETIMTGTNFV